MSEKGLNEAIRWAEELKSFPGGKDWRVVALLDALAQARAELELAKSDLAMAHRVVERHKEAEANAVRIGCENIAARELAESHGSLFYRSDVV